MQNISLKRFREYMRLLAGSQMDSNHFSVMALVLRDGIGRCQGDPIPVDVMTWCRHTGLDRHTLRCTLTSLRNNFKTIDFTHDGIILNPSDMWVKPNKKILALLSELGELK